MDDRWSPPGPVLGAVVAITAGVVLYGSAAAYLGEFGKLILPLLAGAVMVYSLWRGHRAAPVFTVICCVAVAGLAVGTGSGPLTRGLPLLWAALVALLVTVPSQSREWFRTQPPARAR